MITITLNNLREVILKIPNWDKIELRCHPAMATFLAKFNISADLSTELIPYGFVIITNLSALDRCSVTGIPEPEITQLVDLRNR